MAADPDFQGRVPDGARCAKYKSNKNQQSRAPLQAISRGVLMDHLRTRARQTEQPPWRLWVKLDQVNLEGVTVIPFTADFLQNNIRDYIAPGGRPVDLLCDFTHDVCQNHFKMGSLGLAVQHYDHNHYAWQTSCMPSFFVISNKENSPATKPLFECTLQALEESSGRDMKPEIRRKVTDDGKAIKSAATETLPEQPHLVSLQHAKKNVGQQCKWKFGNKSKMVTRWQENTASWPGYVFSFTWRRLQPLLCVRVGNIVILWWML